MSGVRVVEVELKRVQTFLFAIPKLRAMVGANVVLGELLRVRLPILAYNYRAQGLTSGNAAIEEYPERDADTDPLKGKHLRPLDPDTPRGLAQSGVLSRDGGHFRALVDAERCAEFVERTEAMIARHAPGLLFEIRSGALAGAELAAPPDIDAAGAAAALEEDTAAIDVGDPLGSFDTDPGTSVADLPIFQVCTVTGDGPAADWRRSSDDPAQREWRSEQAAALMAAGERFLVRQQCRDMVSLLQPQLPLQTDPWCAPEELDHIAGTGYLAVIHADGNGIGSRATEWTGKREGLSIAHEAKAERFFHWTRVTARRAIVDALAATFGGFPAKDAVPVPGGKGERYRPYQLLMVGGDDVMMLCRADEALDFAVHLSARLAALGESFPAPDGKPLTVGIGIAIARPSVPIYHLADLAEELASSAKQLARGHGVGRSTVDWAVFSASMHEDLGVQRRRDWVRHYTARGRQEQLVLSKRPYPVLGTSTASLESLRKAAAIVGASKELARGQRRALVDALGLGRRSAELVLNEMPAAAREAFGRALAEIGSAGLWETNGNLHTTVALDLVEVTEIPRLGRSRTYTKETGHG